MDEYLDLTEASPNKTLPGAFKDPEAGYVDVFIMCKQLKAPQAETPDADEADQWNERIGSTGSRQTIRPPRYSPLVIGDTKQVGR